VPAPPGLLVIDDDAGILALFRRLCATLPVRLTTASTYKEGLAALAAGPLAMVIADYRLPDGDGLSLLEKVKEQWPACRRVLYTGEAVQESSFDEGTSVLGKPCTAEALEQVILLIVEEASADLQRLLG
jgi:DNA-binding NtrC family response regulator